MKAYPVYYRVSVAGNVRFESVFQRDCETFAREIYKAEGVICDIDEVTR